MREVFDRILKEYLEEKKKPAKGNALYGYLARTECELDFYETNVIDRAQYMVKSSGGQGGWGTIPWICIFDKEIGVTATKGFYIVYLFSADMKRVYLSLNQGWTFYKDTYGVKKGRRNINRVTEMWKNTLDSVLGEFSFDEIDLAYRGNTTDLPRGYELGHICGKYYEASDLPTKEILIRDLQNLLTVFRELKGKMIDVSTEKTINHLLSEYETGSIHEIQNKKEKTLKLIDELIANEAENTTLRVKSDMPDIVLELQNQSSKSGLKAGSYDYIERTKKQEKIGLAGEMMVIEHEKKKLERLEINKKVEHVSKTIGDSAGYDVRSYDENGLEIHIEVKTTKKGINTPFYITQNELIHSRENEDIYQLYRIYNFDEHANTGDMYIVKGNIFEEMHLEPCTYISKGRKR